ncbi:urease accessory protein UreD [Paenibacillus aestuarii]|uniref:Urease accessory protein UreD n=1 Tax=Paenibacillus aestuarii TaxID=516965 RepID=A0ABW0K3J6_9BACL|nr:urease accessory protein UreD [Paenibacillus aestuarii]
MPSVTGEMTAEFAVRRGLTQLVRNYHASPLKIAKTFRFENETLGTDDVAEQLGVYIMDCSPGLMAGDHYEINVRLQEGARVFLTNQSFTKVHPALHGAGCTQRQTLQLAPGALLEYMPEPLMLYKDARLHADMEVYLAPGAALILSDILCPGRTQRGEVFQYTSLRNRMKVWYDDELIYYQNQQIEPQSMQLQAAGCWGQDTHLGSLYVFSDRLGQRHLDDLQEQLDELRDVRVRSGASMGYKHGLIVTMMGTSAWELQHGITYAWRCIRQSLFAWCPLHVHK